jgi:L-malate glycosyltransferase
MKIDQVLCAAGPVDAVTNQALACRQLFTSWGWTGSDYSAVIAPGMPRGAIEHLHTRAGSGSGALLLHYSGYARGIESVVESRPRSLLLSHNITPARFFWDYEPVEAVRCELGRAQLASIGRAAGALAGVSHYNAHDLTAMTGREAEVIPVLFDRGNLAPAAPEPPGPPTILFVGRLVPHKRQDLVIRAFARYRELQPDARLVLVGVPLSPEYGARLHALADQLAPGAVTFAHGISREELASHYQAAHAFLCLSEHEGFCIPLLEAFHFGVPVIARDEGAIAEVIDDAGVLLGPDDNVEVVAELLRIVVGDRDLRSELRARGERRLSAYDRDRTARALRDRLNAVAAA